MEFDFQPQGVCSRSMHFHVEDDKIVDFQVIGGCNGNLEGIRRLIIGENIDTVINKLKGVRCGFKPTSCPDQMAKALEKIKTKG